MSQQFGTKKGKGGTQNPAAGTESAVPGKKVTRKSGGTKKAC